MAWTQPRTWADTPTHDHTAAHYQSDISDNLNWVVRPVYSSTAAIDTRGIASAHGSGTPQDLFAATLPTPDGYTATAIIPAGQMGENGCVRARLVGDYSNETDYDAELTATLTFGDVTIWSSTAVAHTAAERHDWQIRFFIANLNSAVQQFCTGAFSYSMYASMTGPSEAGVGPLTVISPGEDGPYVVPFGSNDIFSVDTTDDVPVTFTILHDLNNPSADASAASFRRYWGALELVGQAV